MSKILFIHGLDSSRESTKFHAIDVVHQAYQIPCVVANPILQPNFRDDYPPIGHHDLQHDIPQFAYLELGDEILDMHAVQTQLEDYMQIQAVDGGHHRLEHPEQINTLIQEIEDHFIRQ